MIETLGGEYLGDASFRSEVPFYDHEATRRADGIVHGPDDLLAGRFGRGICLGSQCLARYSDGGAIEVAAGDEPLGQQPDATGPMKIGSCELAAWLEICQQRRSRADGIEIVYSQLDVGLVGYCQ